MVEDIISSDGTINATEIGRECSTDIETVLDEHDNGESNLSENAVILLREVRDRLRTLFELL